MDLSNPFLEAHRRLGARLVRRDGNTLPAAFADAATEHAAARCHAAVLDRSDVGRIKVTGKDRLDLLQRLCTQHLKERLRPGLGAAAVFATPKGRIVDLAHVFDRGDSLLLLASPSRRAALPDWIRRYILSDDVALTDTGGEDGAFRITGPAAPRVLAALGGIPAGAPGPGGILGVRAAGTDTTVIAEEAGPRPSFLLIAERPGVAALFETAVEAARSVGGGPVGEEVRDVLRIEDGLPEAGAELTGDFNPWEARLDHAISLTKGCYIGQEVVARLDTYQKVSRRLAGLRMGQAEPPPCGTRIWSGPQEAGIVTSSTRSLALGETIALGYLRMAFLDPGTSLTLSDDAGRGLVRATVAGLPVAP